MTYIRDEHIRDTPYQPHELPHGFKLAVIRMLITFYCRLRGVSTEDFYDFVFEQLEANRKSQRIKERHNAKPSANLMAIKPMIPRALGADLSPNQVRERCCRLSTMSRSCLYNLHHYRREYRRIGAQRIRAKAPITKTVAMLSSCGLSDAHVWPD